MDIPLELAFHNRDPSEALKNAVREQVAQLEKLYAHIIGCRVVIEMPHKSHTPGHNAPDVHVVLRVPGREIVVSREQARGASKPPTDAYAVLNDAFRAVTKGLRDHKELQQG